ncbi:reverse transcriptase domain-containing protein [Tanacetum coccineum]
MILKAKLNDEEPCASVIGRKVYEAGFYWPIIFKDAKDYVMKCSAGQKSGNISSQNEIPQNNIQVFDYISKWVEAQALPTNDACVVVKFLKGLFARFRVPKALISDRMVYGKACHLPVEIEHKAYWTLKQCNMDTMTATKNRFMKLNELMELRDGAYENTRIYKERTKKWHDSRLRGDKDFNSRLKLHPGKLKSKWTGPFIFKTMYPYGAVEITDNNGSSFKVNEHRLKIYHDKSFNTDDNEFIELDSEIESAIVF